MRTLEGVFTDLFKKCGRDQEKWLEHINNAEELCDGSSVEMSCIDPNTGELVTVKLQLEIVKVEFE